MYKLLPTVMAHTEANRYSYLKKNGVAQYLTTHYSTVKDHFKISTNYVSHKIFHKNSRTVRTGD